MQEYILYGTVLPERANILCVPGIKAELTLSASQCIRIKQISCLQSKLIIVCQDAGETLIDKNSFKNTVESFVRTIIDALGYTLACGYDVEITGMYNPQSNEHAVFGVHENIFDDLKTNSDTNEGIPVPNAPTVDKILHLTFVHPQLSIALSDFREAIRQPSFTLFHCYRAIESLRYSAPTRKEEDQWNWLFSSLKIKKETKDQLLKIGGGEQRHGKVRLCLWEERKWALFTSWEIIRRFVFLFTEAKKLDSCDEI